MEIWRKKSFWIGILFFIALSIATLLVIRRELGGQNIIEALIEADGRWLAVAGFSMLLYILIDCLNISSGIRHLGYDVSFSQMLLYSFAGFFFSSITPSSSGGQPGQIYYMRKNGIKVSHGSFSTLLALLSYQTMVFLWGVIGILRERDYFRSFESGYKYVFLIGFLLNLFATVFLLSVLFSKKMTRVLAGIIIWFFGGKKIRPEKKHRIIRFFASYHSVSVIIRKNKPALSRILIRSFLQIALYNLITFICARALGVDSADWLTFICTQAAVFVSVSSLPFPGAVGISELGIWTFYGNYIPADMIKNVMLLSRFFSFFLPLIVSGAGILIIQLNMKKYLRTQ